MNDETPKWVWQGFEGPMHYAIAGKILTDALPVEVAGVKIPPPDEPPMIWNKSGTRAQWAIQTRPWSPVPCPDGCEEAETSLVGRLVGA